MSKTKRKQLTDQALTAGDISESLEKNPNEAKVFYLDEAEVENFLDEFEQDVKDIFELLDELDIEHLDNVSKAHDLLYDLKERLY